jgi:carbon-monoxide dehydrogenase large subunit
MLECEVSDIEFKDGILQVVGSNRRLTFLDIVDAAYQGGGLPAGMSPALEHIGYHDPSERSFSSGFHLCAVAIHPETWRVRLLRYVAVDDCGRAINPMIVEGQVHGGIVQGVGQALMEKVSFDYGTGQPLSGSFMDYAMPRASDFCAFDTEIQEIRPNSNELGVRPAGESGTIGAPAAMRNAVVDALRPMNVNHVEMPMTPSNIWAAVSKAQTK